MHCLKGKLPPCGAGDCEWSLCVRTGTQTAPCREAASGAGAGASLTQILRAPNAKLRGKEERSRQGAEEASASLNGRFLGGKGQGGTSPIPSVDTSILLGMSFSGLQFNNTVGNMCVLSLVGKIGGPHSQKRRLL